MFAPMQSIATYSSMPADAKLHMSVQHWYVVYTQPKAEKKVAERLGLAGFEYYLPIITEWKQWSDRKKKIQRPLISSVVFVQCSPEKLAEVYPLYGVSRVLRYLGKPAIVQAHEIENLKIVLNEAIEPLAVESNVLPGSAVEVVRGPFKGLIGTAIMELNNVRIRIELHHLSLAFGVNVPKSFVKALT
jgi:transcription antitermination factor NusG